MEAQNTCSIKPIHSHVHPNTFWKFVSVSLHIWRKPLICLLSPALSPVIFQQVGNMMSALNYSPEEMLMYKLKWKAWDIILHSTSSLMMFPKQCPNLSIRYTRVQLIPAKTSHFNISVISLRSPRMKKHISCKVYPNVRGKDGMIVWNIVTSSLAHIYNISII